MGLYDRDYFREEEPLTFHKRKNGFSAVATIIALNVLLYLIDQFMGPGRLFEKIWLTGADAYNPLRWYHCLTYGFAHDPRGFLHIFCNMFTLFFFGPVLERVYGKAEFWCFYLGSIVFGGIVWLVLHSGAHSSVLGASGGITAIVILFAFKYPKTVIYLYGILPLPTWLAGVLYVLYDAFGAHSGTDNIGHDVHLAGAAFAAFYFFSQIRFTKLFTKKPHGSRSSSGAQKRFASLWAKEKDSVKQWDKKSLEAEVDRILAKYTKYGKSSLTKEEEETLCYASKEFQKWQK